MVKKVTAIKEMHEIWDSYEWYLKDKLISMDNNARAMISEMRQYGATTDMLASFLPVQFERLKDSIVAEQSQKYDQKSRKGARA